MKTATRPDVGVVTTWDQDQWWTTKDGLTHLIDDLDPGHLVNIANLMVKQAAVYHLAKRRWELEWGWLRFGHGDYHDDDMGAPEPPTGREILAIIRREQDKGAHLDWVRGTKLWRRVTRDVWDLLPVDVRGSEHSAEPHGGAW